MPKKKLISQGDASAHGYKSLRSILRPRQSRQRRIRSQSRILRDSKGGPRQSSGSISHNRFLGRSQSTSRKRKSNLQRRQLCTTSLEEAKSKARAESPGCGCIADHERKEFGDSLCKEEAPAHSRTRKDPNSKPEHVQRRNKLVLGSQQEKDACEIS